MNVKSRLVSIALSLLVVLVSLAACGGGPPQPAGSASTVYAARDPYRMPCPTIS